LGAYGGSDRFLNGISNQNGLLINPRSHVSGQIATDLADERLVATAVTEENSHRRNLPPGARRASVISDLAQPTSYHHVPVLTTGADSISGRLDASLILNVG
jgi:hypothetical protein